MKHKTTKTFLIALLASFLIAACNAPTQPQPDDTNQSAPTVTSVNETLNQIIRLDNHYATSYRNETLQNMTMKNPEIERYIQDLGAIRDQLRMNGTPLEHSNYLIDYRQQTLASQLLLQRAFIDIGDKGRVTDGFRCSHLPAIRQSTALLDRSLQLGKNATLILDTLLTENDLIRERIGTDQNKPAFYTSNFVGVANEIRSNVVGMKQYCNATVTTTYLNVTIPNSTGGTNVTQRT